MAEKVIMQGDVPQSRFGHTITQINSNLVVLFGGATGDTGKYSITGEVFACDITLRRWRKFTPQGMAPTNRAAHCAVSFENSQLVIFGGAIGGGGLADDNIYTLDLSQGEVNSTWKTLPTVGSTPGRRYGHSMVYIKPQLVVFGGNTGSEPVNDTWTLDLLSSPFGWRKLEIAGDLPQARVYHSAVLCTSGAANGMMVIFGGRSGDQQAQNDTWGLRKHRDNRWDWVKAPYKNNSEDPIPRYQHSTVFQGPLMLVVGGRSNQINDQIYLEIYDIETSDWNKFAGVQRFRHSIWIMDNFLYVHGGFDSEQPNVPTDSIVRLDLTKLLQNSPNLMKKMPRLQERVNTPARSGMEIEDNRNINNLNANNNYLQQQQLQLQQQQLQQQQQQQSQYNQYMNIKPQQQQQQQEKQIRLATDAVIAITYDPNVQQDASIKKVPVNKLQKQCLKLSNTLFRILSLYVYLPSFLFTHQFNNYFEFLDQHQRIQTDNGQQRKQYQETIFQPFLDILLQPEYINQGQSNKDLVSQIRRDNIFKLCDEVQKVFERESMVLRIRAPVKIFGSLNGQFEDLMRFFNHFGSPCDSEMIDEDIDGNEYLFLGNYVGKGAMQLEVILLLFSLKLKYFDQFHMLRGSMEDRRINKAMGLADECAIKFKEDVNDPNSVFQKINKVFEYMPLAGVIEDSIFCIHSGIGTTLRNISEIEQIPRPLDIIQDPKTYQHKVALELLWSDPAINEGQNENSDNNEHDLFNLKNIVRFGLTRTNKFMQDNSISLIIRSHEPVMNGIQRQANNIISLFSNSNYCNKYQNSAAILCISKNTKFQPKVIQPIINVNNKYSWLELDISLSQKQMLHKQYIQDQEEILLRKKASTPPRDNRTNSNIRN